MLYNFIIFLYLVFFFPKMLWELIFYNKKKKDLLQRLGIKKYVFNPQDKSPVIWIHAVSVGETKAAYPLLEKLKEEYPASYIIVSSTTATGNIEAKKNLKADLFVFFPFDFSFVVKKIFKQIQPNLVVFIETDLWLNFIKEAKKNNAKVIIASAKISKRSLSRFLKFSRFSKRLFSYFDLILTQNDQYKERFQKICLKENIYTCGNLKFISTPDFQNKPLASLKAKLNIKNERIITIGSTHASEEELLVKELKDIPGIKILLAPRHPERFNLVYNQIRKITTCSLLSKNDQDTKVIVIDCMGLLNDLYKISILAIVGGSFVPNVGGHNILEPVFVRTPVFFGPYMYTQTELRKIVLDLDCGKELVLTNIKASIVDYLNNPEHQKKMQKNCLKINKIHQNILENYFSKIKKII